MHQSKKIEKEFVDKIARHQGILHKICMVYTGQQANKEDLYQEIVLQLWKSYPSFQERSSFSTWMYRVALNTAISFTRKAKMIFVDLKTTNLVHDPEAAQLHSEEVKLLYRAITTLSKVEKAIVLMWLDELSYDEIATTLGISTKLVSVKLVRIKKKLSEHIQRIQ